ncbi:hypothetical protein CFC21_037067 [Triticum aestivum]|uniref:F-box domain-containing protein n=2 Tax=Triticum aestivum TaxID=4565 RepID=A0A9R1JPC4_WHEAT|nr:uncharacterized protein LOC123062715 [Triticum aestivum]KAF7024776.1 hypothetical protein CFC21_037067 [Triticum aestivum]
MGRRRRQPSSPSPAAEHPLEDDDLLREILLRLPPQPPYLLRASLVAKRWRHIAIDPKFLHRFRTDHGKPPLLGDFSLQINGKLSFRSTLDLPYRIPPDHFSLQVNGREPWRLVDCRHRRVLLINSEMRQVIVWDPLTGDRSLLSAPPAFDDMHTAAVLCAAGEQGHAHGACHSSPFKVVVVDSCEHGDETVVFVSVYSSETGVWSDLLSTPLASMGIAVGNCSTLVGNTFHWLLLMSNNILEFDLDRQTLAVINRPPGVRSDDSAWIIQADDGGVGFSALSCAHCQYVYCYHQPCFQMWDRKANCYGVAVWVLRKSIGLQKLLGLGFKIERNWSHIVRYAEHVHALFLWVHSSLFIVQLESMQPKELFKSDPMYAYYPFTSFYDEGISGLKQK